MAGNALKVWTKWVLVPVGLGFIGFFFIGPRLYLHAPQDIQNKVVDAVAKADPNLKTAPGAKTIIDPGATSSQPNNGDSSGPAVVVTESPVTNSTVSNDSKGNDFQEVSARHPSAKRKKPPVDSGSVGGPLPDSAPVASPNTSDTPKSKNDGSFPGN